MWLHTIIIRQNRWLSEFLSLNKNFIVDKRTIAKALNNLGKDIKPRPKVKSYEQQKIARIDWCTRYINSTNFYYVFFADKCTFYLDNTSGRRWIKVDEDNIP